MKLPPYGRDLAQGRQQGLVPEMVTGYFVVALGWGIHRQLADMDDCPRVVLPLDVAIQDYNLRPLAGLDLILVHAPEDFLLVDEVVDCLLAVRPASLISCALDGSDWRVHRDGPLPLAALAVIGRRHGT